MIDRDRRDDRGTWPRDDIGCIEPSAETDFQQQIIGGMLAEKLERRRGGDFEEGDRLTVVAFSHAVKAAKSSASPTSLPPSSAPSLIRS